MEFVLYCSDRQDGGKARQAVRARHLAYVADRLHRFVYAGQLLGPDGATRGSVIILRVKDRAELDDHMSGDPYFAEEVFESVVIWPAKQVVPELAPGGFAAELA